MKELESKILDKFSVLKKAIERYIDTGGKSEEQGCIPNFLYFFKYMFNKFDEDPDEVFEWDKETSDDFWTWGHNSRWAHTAWMWIDDHLEECIDKAIELAEKHGDLNMED